MREPSQAAVLPDAPRILAIKLGDVGDGLLTLPAVRALKTRYPDGQLEVLTTPSAAPAYWPVGTVDAVHRLDRSSGGGALAAVASLRGRHFDALALFHSLTTRAGALRHAALSLGVGAPIRAGLAVPGSLRGWFLTHRAEDRGFDGWHQAEAYLAVAAVLGAAVPRQPRLVFEPGSAATARAAVLLGSLAGRPAVALHPGSGPYSPARRWPVQHWRGLARGVTELGLQVVVVGTGNDDSAAVAATTPGAIDLTDRTDLPTLGAVLARMTAVVATDGGVMHLATAVGTPTLAVFGPSNPMAWGPWQPPGAGPRHAVVGLSLACRPCFYVGHGLGARLGCPTRDCLAWLGHAPVLSALMAILADNRTGAAD